MGGPKQRGIKTYGALYPSCLVVQNTHPCSHRSLPLPPTSPCRYAPCLRLQRFQTNHATASLRRSPPHVLYVIPFKNRMLRFFARAPSTFLTLTIIIVYGVYYWAKTKYDYYNSKQGHFDHLIEEGVIKPGQYERPTVGPVVH